jgi:hypothetical protein
LSWHQRYVELDNFRKAHGHLNVSPVADAPLYAWCSDQLHRLKAVHDPASRPETDQHDKVKGMGPDRIKLLADMGFTKDLELVPVECEEGAAAVAAEEAARELDEHSSFEEDDSHHHHEDMEGMEEEHSHHEGLLEIDGSAAKDCETALKAPEAGEEASAEV